jgi:hypothetical protein
MIREHIFCTCKSSFLFVNYKFCLENSSVIGLFEIVENKFRQKKTEKFFDFYQTAKWEDARGGKSQSIFPTKKTECSFSQRSPNQIDVK